MIPLDEKNNHFAILFLWLFDMYNIFALVEMLSLEPRIDHKICIMSNNRQSRYKSRITGRPKVKDNHNQTEGHNNQQQYKMKAIKPWVVSCGIQKKKKKRKWYLRRRERDLNPRDLYRSQANQKAFQACALPGQATPAM